MAVPGNVLSGRSRGAHGLIRDGAKIVETADDILEEIGQGGGSGVVSAAGGTEPDVVLRHMDTGETYDLDALIALSGLDGAALLARLLDLELRGRVARAAAGTFVRLPG